MLCILCGNVQVELFKIDSFVRDNIVEIFGTRIDNCISNDQVICKPCCKLLEKYAKLKRRLRYLILQPTEDRKPVNLTQIWKLFSNLELDSDIGEIGCVPTPTPSSLYTLTHSQKYYVRTPVRRRRGHRWTRRKWSCSSRSSRSRANTPYSDISYLTKSSRRSQRTSTTIIDDDEEENKPENDFYENKLYCPAKNCGIDYMNVDVLDTHLQRHHNTAALFYCSECSKNFTTSEYLKLHIQKHDFSPFFCLMCGETQANRFQLRHHLDQHMIYSIPCAYCDRFFLQEDLLKRHQKLEHDRKVKEKIVYRKKLILEHVVYEKNTVPQEQTSNIDISISQVNDENRDDNLQDSNERTSRNVSDKTIALNQFRSKDFNVIITPQNSDGLSMTLDNILLEQLKFYQGDGYEEIDSGKDDKEEAVISERESDESTCSEKEPTELAINNDASNVTETSDPLDISGIVTEQERGSANNGATSDNRSSLMNGFSEGNEMETLDLVSDEVGC